MDRYELIDNKGMSRYEYRIDKHIPLIEYVKTADGDVFLTHTEVPAQLRGQGIATALATDVLRDIESQKLKLVPLCPFVAAFIKQHPEWKRLLKVGINIK